MFLIVKGHHKAGVDLEQARCVQNVVLFWASSWQHMRQNGPLGATAGAVSCDSAVLFIGMVIKAISWLLPFSQWKLLLASQTGIYYKQYYSDTILALLACLTESHISLFIPCDTEYWKQSCGSSGGQTWRSKTMWTEAVRMSNRKCLQLLWPHPDLDVTPLKTW